MFAPGQAATVSVDTYPDRHWHGTVESISPAAAQEFQLLPAQNTSGNWVKVVQRVPMRVRVDASDKQPAAFARRDERRGERRYRPRARIAALSVGAVRPLPPAIVMIAMRNSAGNGNSAAITVCVILATLMQALDTTIANVALPYMQGTVSASQDQIAWVLTSYIVAAAIMTPPTGFLAARFGLKRLFLVSMAGFTLASMLCGMAESLDADRVVPAAAGRLRRGAGAALAIGAARLSIPRSARASRWRCSASGSWSAPCSGRCSADGSRKITAGASFSTSTCRSAFSGCSA